ncbi:hypothetical protein [Bradyrhizobium manausense]|uniref:hypothetical protein n=1 Tax=Bradyrhizobium manausense TaxID=989370 RepID=UPI001BA83A1D|nr:hypothetical protein [Bradyrhizobium manausense]MBR0724183.1 hypothetical protein [Bradyrhizobium manausense]
MVSVSIEGVRVLLAVEFAYLHERAERAQSVWVLMPRQHFVYAQAAPPVRRDRMWFAIPNSTLASACAGERPRGSIGAVALVWTTYILNAAT